ncbi:MAG: fluoride efflux transporter CrcB [Candidatus Nanopelagicales bacterium]|nr:fluoride efflux transporter CrcB [Candidatus Nanopelagicales bacterium]
MRLLQIALGGAVGSLARYGIAQTLPWSDGFPWATLIINVVGALAIGVVATTVVDMRPWVRPVVIVGVLGGFTTFSAFALQTGTLLDAGHVMQALVYLALTMVAGLVAVEIGAALGPRFRRVTS